MTKASDILAKLNEDSDLGALPSGVLVTIDSPNQDISNWTKEDHSIASTMHLKASGVSSGKKRLKHLEAANYHKKKAEV